jgi:two-component system, NtrC family, sensor kinase
MTFIFLGILGLLALISVYVVWQGAKSEQHHQMMEESLRLSENKYRLLAETAREIILLFDTDLNIVYGNSAWKRISGYDDRTISEKRLADLVPPAMRGELFACISRLEGDRLQDFLLETQFVLSDQRTIVVEATFAKMTAAGENETYLLTARDITERKKIEAQAKMQQEQLMQTNKMVSLGTLVSGVAHEINNPISSVMLNLQVFEKFWRAAQPVLDRHHEQAGNFAVGGMLYPQLRDRMPKLLHFSLEGATRIKRIVGDLKDFSGQRPSELRETVNLNQEVEKAVGMVSSLIKKATKNFRMELDENLPTLQGNSQRLGQVIINLLVNACQALTDQSQEVQVITGYLEESEEIVLEVRDCGGGMPAEVLARIKDPFFTTRRDNGGTGLGLAISDTIIRNHGGWLLFASTPGQGTVATVLLPRYGPDEIAGRMI